jgi:prepilin-type N-terminal cleavage/methylation domain-containing protein
MQRRRLRCTVHDAGFSLVEVIIATALLAIAIAGLAQLFAMSVMNNTVGRHTTMTAALAAQKVEQLRGDGGLAPGLGNTLQQNTDRYVDFLDPAGVILANSGTIAPDATAYVRRWSVEPVPGTSALLLQVLVTRRRSRGNADAGFVARAPEEARVVTVARPLP